MGARIFIVDDDTAAREALAFLLRALGWDVLALRSATECLAALEGETPHCVVTDLLMPAVSGVELAERLRSRDVPVVVLTGFDVESPLARRATELGARVLQKPCGDQALDAALREARAPRPREAPPPSTAATATARGIDDAEFRRMFEVLPEPRAILSPDLRILAANDCYCRVTLTKAQDIVGRYVFDIFPDNPEDPSGKIEAEAMFRRVIETRQNDRVIQKYSLHRPAEQGGGLVERFWSTSAAPVLAPDGTLQYIVVRPEDVTEYLRDAGKPGRRGEATGNMELELFRRAREVQAANEQLRREIEQRAVAEQEREEAMAELARSNEDLAQFAYVVSHDLQAPLAAIAQFAEILRRQLGEAVPAPAREALGHIESGAQRMSALIRDLLALARVGRRQERIVPVDIGDIMDVARAQLEADLKRAQGQLRVQAALPRVAGNPVELVQLFQNLIGNALKFHAPGRPPVVTVAAGEEGAGRWHFTVADNGIGIAPSDHDAIFAPFRRGVASEPYAGTGIGLALCKKIVERHGGRIWVESAPGQGSRFHFTLPAERRAQPRSASMAARN